MHYTWKLAIKALQNGMNPHTIRYKFDDDFSPYIEVNFTDLNEQGIPQEVYINPYYRYYSIFKELLNPDLTLGDDEFKRLLLNVDYIKNNLPDEVFKSLFFPDVPDDPYRQLLRDDERMRKMVLDQIKEKYLDDEKYGQKYLHDTRLDILRHRDLKTDSPVIVENVLDLTVHHLIDIDVLMGMNRREYHINFVINDMHRGYFGSYVKKGIGIFSRGEQVIIANCLLSLYATAEEVHVLKESVRRIFIGSCIFSNAEERDEIVFWLRTKETPLKVEKMEVLQHLFLPFKCTCEIYWENIFGVIDVPEMMITGEISLY